MRSLKVKSASEDRVVISLVDPNADPTANVNNQRDAAVRVPRTGSR
jgi:hypothetical protein